jgi:hypothetical protein
VKRSIRLDSPFLDAISDTEEINKRLPDDRIVDMARAAAEERQYQKEMQFLDTMHQNKVFAKRIATNIPAAVLGAMAQIDPEFGRGRGIGRERFLRWLKEHPEWDATGKVGR